MLRDKVHRKLFRVWVHHKDPFKVDPCNQVLTTERLYKLITEINKKGSTATTIIIDKIKTH